MEHNNMDIDGSSNHSCVCQQSCYPNKVPL